MLRESLRSRVPGPLAAAGAVARGPAARERFDAATFAQALLAVFWLFGLIPGLAVVPLVRISAATLGGPPSAESPRGRPRHFRLAHCVVPLPVAGVLACLALAARRGLRRVPTWTCGSPVTPAAQYTATAFSKPLRMIFAFVLRPEHRRLVETGSSSWFPDRIVYQIESRDVVDEVARWFGALAFHVARRSRALQSGSLRLYLAYAVAALVPRRRAGAPMIALSLLQLLVIVAFAPLVQGSMKLMRARLQGRPGPSALQPYRDLAKLWCKESIVPDGVSPIAVAAPGIALGVALTLCAALPLPCPAFRRLARSSR